MQINSKVIFAKTKKGFEKILPLIPQGLDPIVFIEETKEIWTCGKFFSVGDPVVSVEDTLGSVKVNIGDQSVNFTTSGESLGITKGTGNEIILSSNALTMIQTESPLAWDNVTKTLSHLGTLVKPGSYGPSADSSNVSTFRVPSYTVDDKGHIISSESRTISIRDNTEQLAPSTTPGFKNVILSNGIDPKTETGPVRKANGLLFDDELQKLKVLGGIEAIGDVNVFNGNLKVEGGKIIGNLEGDITGEAIPKIHLSDIPEFGGASLNMYGHVKLQDDFKGGMPAPSSNNTDKANAEVLRGVAASPLLVWDAMEEAKKHADDKPNIGVIAGNLGSMTIDIPNKTVTILGTNGVKIKATEENIIIQGISMSAVSPEGAPVGITERINYTNDFELDEENNLSLRWTDVK